MSSQRSDWRERLHANPSRIEQELAIKLQEDGVHYQTQVEIPVTTADFYFPLEARPLLVFVDGRVHLGTRQMSKDEELRSLLRNRGYRVLELSYISYSDKKRNELYKEIRNSLSKIAYQTWGQNLPV
jgi:very-short-patch-repair endonuclease